MSICFTYLCERSFEVCIYLRRWTCADVKTPVTDSHSLPSLSEKVFALFAANITDKEHEATPCSTGLQDSSSSDANTVTPDTSSSTPPTDSIAVNTSAKQETDSTKTGADSEGKEGGEEKEGVGEEEGEATVGETVTVSASEADVGSGEKTDPVTDTSLTSSSAEPAEENISVDSSLPHPVPREAETVPATSSEASTSSSEVSAPSTSLPETTDNTSPSSSPIDTTSTTTSSSPVDTITTTTTSTSAVDTTTSKEDKVKESLSAEAEPTGSMDLDSMDFSNSVLQAAESSEASTVASSSEIKDMQGAEVSDSSSQPEPMEQDWPVANTQSGSIVGLHTCSETEKRGQNMLLVSDLLRCLTLPSVVHAAVKLLLRNSRVNKWKYSVSMAAGVTCLLSHKTSNSSDEVIKLFLVRLWTGHRAQAHECCQDFMFIFSD